MSRFMRIHSLSLLSLLVICAVTNSTPVDKTLQDSRIHRIKPLPSKSHLHHNRDDHHHHEHDLNHVQHEIHGIEKSKSKSLDKKPSHLTNKQLLSKLGLAKMKIPASHSRKRLAVESRHHARPDDSHMFIIKLPPNPYYYTNSKPAEPKNSLDDTGKQVSFSFRSNGKPGRVYHWNIPVLKKIIAGSNPDSFSRHNDRMSDLIDIKNTPTWSKPWENETIEKAYGKLNDETNSVKKKKSPTYYAPAKQKKNNFNKYFPGNGKPQSFYVIQKNHKSAYYQKLIP